MTMTAPLLRSWRPGALEASSIDIEAIRRVVDTATGDFSAVTALTRNGVWEGDAADAAAANAHTTLRRLDVLTEALGMLRRSLVAAADALTAAKALLDRADDLAGQYGMRVSTQGYVTFRGDRDQDPDAYTGAKDAERFAQEAIRAAWEADRDAAHAVRSIFTAAADGNTSDPADRALVAEITLRDIPTADAHPRFVAAWWASLSVSAQGLLIARSPERIGNLDGLPVAARDRANRSVLATTISGLAATLTGLQARLDALGPITGRAGPSSPHVQIAQQMVRVREQSAMLEVVRDELDKGEGSYRLMLLDTELPGKAAIAIGDVDTADHVAILVPGMGSHVTNYMPIITENAQRVVAAANRVLRADGAGQSVAAIAWIGYHAPMGADVLSDAAAHQGAPALASTLWGIQESRAATGDVPHVTTVTHSYGSLVGGLTADTDAPIEDLVIIGSPGVDASSVDDLGLPASHVFVATAHDDLVGDSGWFGTQPANFGGTVFQTDGGSHPLSSIDTLDAEGHSEYYKPDSESLLNITAVVTGHPEDVTLVPAFPACLSIAPAPYFPPAFPSIAPAPYFPIDRPCPLPEVSP